MKEKQIKIMLNEMSSTLLQIGILVENLETDLYQVNKYLNEREKETAKKIFNEFDKKLSDDVFAREVMQKLKQKYKID
jgi:hypothetical protein